MPTPVKLPKLGNTVEDCLIAKWIKKVGDAIEAGETVVEIETDKAVQEIASPVSGTLLAAFFEEGALVPVFTNLFVVGNQGEDYAAFRPDTAAQKKTTSDLQATQCKQTAAEPEPVSVGAAPPAGGTPGKLSPRAHRFANEHNFLSRQRCRFRPRRPRGGERSAAIVSVVTTYLTGRGAASDAGNGDDCR